jgi:hypothetical protein
MSAIDIETVKSALRTWVIRGSGLPPDHVVWTLGARRPDSSYIHMRLKVGTVGQDLVKYTPNPSPTSGNDALFTVVGARILTFTVTCFAPTEPNQGARSPEQILNDVFTSYSFPSVTAVVKAAKLGWLTNTDITPIDLLIDKTLFEPRAYMTIRLHTIAQLSETGPSIDTVEISGTTAAGTDAFVVDSTLDSP